MLSFAKYAALLGLFFFSAWNGVFTKKASEAQFLSPLYLICTATAVIILLVHAILWQQIIKYIPIAKAYMFKGSALIFGLLICHYILGESITLSNIVGATLIITGITLYSRA